MPQISEIEVRFARKIQVRDYEPAESEVKLKAIVLADEDPIQVLKFLQELASGEVHEAIGLPRSTSLLPNLPSRAIGVQTVRSAGMVGEAAKETHPLGVDIIPSQADVGAAVRALKSDGLDIPATPSKATVQPPVTQAAGDLGIPASSVPAPANPVQQPASANPTPPVTAAVAPTTLTAAELSKWIGEQVRSGKVSSDEVKGLYPKFKVTRFADLKADQVGAVKDEVEKLLKGNTGPGVVMA